MTLDEQILFMEELLDDDDHWSCENSKSGYRQLLEWLKDYKRLLEMSKGGLTGAEKRICKIYLEDLDKTHTCNEYKLLMNLIDNVPTTDIHKSNCVNCDHFGKCEGCEKGEEE